MRDPLRQRPIVEKFYRVWATVPDWRFGQLMINLTRGYDTFNVEDDVLEARLDLVLKGGWEMLR